MGCCPFHSLFNKSNYILKSTQLNFFKHIWGNQMHEQIARWQISYLRSLYILYWMIFLRKAFRLLVRKQHNVCFSSLQNMVLVFQHFILSSQYSHIIDTCMSWFLYIYWHKVIRIKVLSKFFIPRKFSKWLNNITETWKR